MDSDELEDATERLRRLLRNQVPDLLLQAECGGDLELPSPLPWGFASVPTLYELADIAERELYDQRRESELRDQHDRQHQPSSSQPPEADGRQAALHQPREPLGQDPEESQPYAQGPPQWPPPSPAPQQCDPQPDVHNERRGDGGLPRGRTPPPLGQPPPSSLLPQPQPSQAQQQQPQQQPQPQPQRTLQGRELQGVHAGDTGCAQHHAQLGDAAASASPGWDGGPEDVAARSRERGGRCLDASGGSERQVEGGCAAGVVEPEITTASAPQSSQTAGSLAAGESHGGQGTANGARAAGGGTDGHRDGGTPNASTPPVGADAGDQGTVGDQGAVVMEPAAEAAPASAPELPPPPVVYVCTAFLESLEQSRTFRSPHCEGAMVGAMGMLQLYDGLAGSTLGPPPAEGDLEALRSLLKDHINARWALEAVKQGVAAAKQGNYADAHKAYARALELDPRSAEAYVARGAAHANQRAFAEAEHDLRHALSLEPGHRNATAYLEAVLRHVEAQRQQLEQLELERQQALARQHQHQQGRQRSGGRGPTGGKGGSMGPGAFTPGPALGAGRAAGGEALAAGVQGRGGPGSEPPAGRRRRGSVGSGSSSSSGTASSLSGSSGSGTPGRGVIAATQRPASDDIKRALEVVLKARKTKRKSKRKKHKKKHKKAKRLRRD